MIVYIPLIILLFIINPLLGVLTFVTAILSVIMDSKKKKSKR